MQNRVPFQRSHRVHVAILLLAFAVTRILAAVAGLHYLGSEQLWNMQLLDLDILQHHLLRALFHLHAQPPLFNLCVGLAEKMGGDSFGSILLGWQLLLGLGAVLSVYFALVTLKAPPSLSLAVSLLLLLNPAVMLYEFDPLYTEMVYAANCFIALALARYLRGRSNFWLYSLVALCVLLTLLRATYQWIWIAMLFAVLGWQLPANRRQLRTAAIVAVALACLWPAKNYLLFRHFSSTTWAPFSLRRHFIAAASPAAMARWKSEGLIPTFNAPEITFRVPSKQLTDYLRKQYPVAATGAPELDDLTKARGGDINWNSLVILHLHDAQAKDIEFLLIHDWKAYLWSLRLGVWSYFLPSTDYFVVHKWPQSVAQYEHLARLDQWAGYVCCSPFGLPNSTAEDAGSPAAASRFLRTIERIRMVCWGAVLAFMLLLATLFSFRGSLWEGCPERKAAAAVLGASVLYAFLVGNLVEFGENMRYRHETQPLVFIVIALFVYQLWVKRRKMPAETQASD